MSGITPTPAAAGPTTLGVDARPTADGQKREQAPAAPGRSSAPATPAGQAQPASTTPAVTLGQASGGPPLAATFEPKGTPGLRLELGLRLLPQPMPGNAAPSGLPATVLGPATSTAGSNAGLLLDLAGHRVTLPADSAALPPGTQLAIQLLPPGGAAPVQDSAGLDRLLADLVRQGAGAAEAGKTGGQNPAAGQPLPVDAGLAARLVADWQRLAGRGLVPRPNERAGAAGGGKLAGKTGGLDVEVEGGRVLVGDRDTGWRGLFGLLGNPGEAAAPMAAWRREADADGAKRNDEERLLLTLDLSRLGRTVIDLRITERQMRARVVSDAPLPEPLRRELEASFAAAAELDGRDASLTFGLARRASATDNDHQAHCGKWA